jgi:hypothetical protein
MRNLAEFAGFQAVWLACAFGAAAGLAWPGIAAAAVYLAAQLATAGNARATGAAVLASGAVGLALESVFAASGLVHYAAPWPGTHLAPAWMIALWLAFGASLGVTSRLLGERATLKAALLGAIGGPLAYYAGARIGALTPGEPAWIAYGAIACAWAVVFSGLIALFRRLG